MNAHQVIAGGTRAEAVAAEIARWEPRPMPTGWTPLRPFVTEDGTSTRVETPSWVPRFRTPRRPSTRRLDPLL